MDRRQSPRVEVQLPVEVWGVDAHGQPFTVPAMVTNMSANGLVLHGVRRNLRLGELLDIRLGGERAQVRVVWIGGQGTQRAGQLGMQKVTSEPIFLVSVLTHCSQTAAAC
jgi:hypothetical protein